MATTSEPQYVDGRVRLDKMQKRQQQNERPCSATWKTNNAAGKREGRERAGLDGLMAGRKKGRRAFVSNQYQTATVEQWCSNKKEKTYEYARRATTRANKRSRCKRGWGNVSKGLSWWWPEQQTHRRASPLTGAARAVCLSKYTQENIKHECRNRVFLVT